MGVVVKTEDIIQSCLRCMVMSCVETLIPKHVRLWSLKIEITGEKKKVDQGHHGKSSQKRIWKDMA